MSGRSATLRIRTPEGVEFPLPLAGPVIRCLAWFVDFLVVTATFSALSRLLVPLAAVFGDAIGALSTLLYFAMTIGYAMALEYFWGGRTLGKKFLGLRVVDAQGLRLTGRQVILRNLLRFIDNLPLFYLVGGLACFFSRRAQRLGDLAASTVVVRTPRVAPPDASRLERVRFNSLRDHPHLCARLRQKAAPEIAAAALAALLRRDGYDPTARVALFAGFADYFRPLAPFPAEAVEGLSDEQYTRNCVEVLFG